MLPSSHRLASSKTISLADLADDPWVLVPARIPSWLRDLAMSAAEAGADYVAFGAFFPSTTKTVTAPASLEIVEWWSELFEIPCVAIGGITVGNCQPVVAAGADFLAVAGGVWKYKDGPEAAVRAFNELFASADR